MVTQLDSVYVHKVRSFWDKTTGGIIEMEMRGHFTEVASASRAIAETIIRGKNRWWFDSVVGEMDENAGVVSEMNWKVIVKYGD